MNRIYALLLFVPLTVHCAAETAELSVKEVMLEQITPASNVLWGADDPQTDEAWLALAGAADELLAAFEGTRKGGTGPCDTDWTDDDKWQDFVADEVAALNNAKTAISTRDFDGLLEANEALYTPCESCHIEYNFGACETG